MWPPRDGLDEVLLPLGPLRLETAPVVPFACRRRWPLPLPLFTPPPSHLPPSHPSSPSTSSSLFPRLPLLFAPEPARDTRVGRLRAVKLPDLILLFQSILPVTS